jgi:hypothetical protein
VKQDLEAIRVGVAALLGERAVSVRSAVRDHGYFRGISVETPGGWRHAVAIGDDDTWADVAAALLTAMARRAR